MRKVTISLVTFNGGKYIEGCLDSLFKQGFKDFNVLLIDNGSKDNTVELSRKYPVNICTFEKNIGFAAGHNVGILKADSEYVFVLNQDIILDPDFLGTLVKVLDERPDVASVGGKMLKMIPGKKILDTTGLIVQKTRQVIDRGGDQEDCGQYDKPEEIFGISGAAVLYRKKALEDIRLDDEFFDKDFFSYQEDFDLAWRLQRAGWKAYYEPRALGWHYRGSGSSGEGLKSQIRNWFRKSDFIISHSYRNHLFALLKNEQWRSVLPDAPWVLAHEASKIIGLLLRPKSLAVLPIIFKKMPKIMAKRRRQKIRQSSSEIRSLWISR